MIGQTHVGVGTDGRKFSSVCESNWMVFNMIVRCLSAQSLKLQIHEIKLVVDSLFYRKSVRPAFNHWFPKKNSHWFLIYFGRIYNQNIFDFTKFLHKKICHM